VVEREVILLGRLRPFEALRSPQDLEEMVSRVEPLARGAS